MKELGLQAAGQKDNVDRVDAGKLHTWTLGGNKQEFVQQAGFRTYEPQVLPRNLEAPCN